MKNKRLKIYVAGPYSAYSTNLHDISRLVQKNVDKAIEIGNKLRQKGHIVFVPHLSHYLHIHYTNKYDMGQEYWYDYDMSFLNEWANAFFFIGHSRGADMELERAKELKLKIYYNIEDVPKV